ncbi:ankyrin repeat and SOCS box protein 10 isoform X2 [Gopherus flavomarginatus]|uniref:ankyrin repeat and SOCS box protein 10 isoform X2 n=1 Tax=Gopherus flavomarginatus TaxID=286002 RepID=UPI0021CC0D51|nr:ankyrin repeat and SOCS box protein 10 isoform X2 [Gopherus flavomarginatus]
MTGYHCPFSSALQPDEELVGRRTHTRHMDQGLAAPTPRGWGFSSSRMEPIECRDVLVQNALFTGDLEAVRKHFTDSAAVNLIIESKGDELRWTSRKLGLWSLTYEQELTTPLHITAGRGYLDCLRHLLLRGAAVDFAPGGKTALHEACAAARTDCVRLLLSFGADPKAGSEAGYQPLHLCKSPASIQCAQLLLQYGASVNSQTEEEEDTALHVAARYGLEEHVRLYLCHGAGLEAKNEEGQTPLNAACAQAHPPQDMERYYRVCQQLVQSGANIDAADRDRQRPLHQACKNASPRVVELLLAHGASVNIMSYSGNTAMHNILQVLRYCCSSPRTIEVLINSYDRVRVTDEWAEAVPAEIMQKHPDFYESLFSLGQRPRSLQHLARCALRSYLEGRLLQVLPELHLPSSLHQFLLLSFEDILY